MLKKLIVSVALVAASLPAWSADMANGQKLNKSCALCHGVHGQGTSGKLSPRIAGLPKEYIIKAMKDYIDGTRNYPLMVKTSQLDKYTEKDFDDVATYLSALDLSSDANFNIASSIGGDAKEGKSIYKGDCKTCHGRDGYGKPRKGAPPLAGQHPEYIYTSIVNFRNKVRMHDNDPEDETFKEYSDTDVINVTAHLATLDDKRVVEGYAFEAPTYRASAVARASELNQSIQITDIVQTVVRMAVNDGVTPEQAGAAMNAKAKEIGLRKVAQQKVSKFLAKKGVKMPHLSIYQFCNPMDAREMVIADPVFSSYMPCRISMVEDKDGKLWLMMLNLDMLINSKLLPASVVETAVRVNQQMLDVMTAGASGGK
jgi:cytochrome c553/uncharacterized protein (DUF302 family)